MQDKDLYFHIMGLTPPWSIKKLDLDPVNQVVDILNFLKKMDEAYGRI